MEQQAELLLVIEIPESKKILCQADGCGHSVYRRVHVVRESGKYFVYGEDCARKIFGKSLKKPLIPQERLNGYIPSARDIEQLLNNTREFVSDIEKQFTKPELVDSLETPDFSKMSDGELQKFCLNQVKDEFRKEKKLDPDLPGWAGWVNSDAKALFKKLRGDSS